MPRRWRCTSYVSRHTSLQHDSTIPRKRGGGTPQTNPVPFEKMDGLDQYMLRQTWTLVSDVRKWYDDFAFHKIYQAVIHFCVVDLSAFYFDIIKDRLYTYAPNSLGRRSAKKSYFAAFFTGAGHNRHEL